MTVSSAWQWQEVIDVIQPARDAALQLVLLTRDSDAAAHAAPTVGSQPALSADTLRILPRLAVATSSFMRHIVTPISSLAPPTSHEQSAATTASCDDHWSRPATAVRTVKQVVFRLFLVQLHTAYDPVGPGFLDVEALRRELSQLAASSQEVSLSFHTYVTSGGDGHEAH